MICNYKNDQELDRRDETSTSVYAFQF